MPGTRFCPGRTLVIQGVAGLALLVGLFWSESPAAWHRTQHFAVEAPSKPLALEIGQQAEFYRKELLALWSDSRPLPGHPSITPIRATVSRHLGNGGATSFSFGSGPPASTMRVQGSREGVLAATLPHEVCHVVFAELYRRPLPRWCDEGACSTVESPEHRAKINRALIHFLSEKPSRGIAFNRMVMYREYPEDILPFYAQSHSVVTYLIGLKGRKHFARYMADGSFARSTAKWDQLTRSYYGFRDLSDLQNQWLEWVRTNEQVGNT